jgi:hypothetical protein
MIKSRRMKWAGYVAQMREKRKEITRKTNMAMDLGEKGWGGVEWIGLAQDRDQWRALVNAAMNLRVSGNAGKLLSGLTSSAQQHKVS